MYWNKIYLKTKVPEVNAVYFVTYWFKRNALLLFVLFLFDALRPGKQFSVILGLLPELNQY